MQGSLEKKLRNKCNLRCKKIAKFFSIYFLNNFDLPYLHMTFNTHMFIVQYSFTDFIFDISVPSLYKDNPSKY